MWKTLSWIKKHLSFTIGISIILGLVIGYFFEARVLKYLIIPSTILMVYPIMVTVNLKKVFSKCSFKLQGTAQMLNFLFIPVLGFLIATTMLEGPHAIGLVMIALLPTSGMTISWTGFAKGNVDAAIKISIIGLIAGTLLAPLYMKLFFRQSLTVPVFQIFKQIALIIIIPLVLGFLTQVFLKKTDRFDSFKTRFSLLATLAVIGIIFVAVSLKAKTIVSSPKIILGLIAPLLLFYIVTYFVSLQIGIRFYRPADVVTLVYSTALRNLSIAMAIALTVFGAESAIIIAIAYIIQIQSAALFLKGRDFLGLKV